MKHYELNYLISPYLKEEEQKSLAERISSYIQEKGNIASVHPAKKQMTSLLFVLDFYSAPKEIEAIEKKLKAEPQIQKYMILTKEAASAKVKPPRRLIKKPAITEKKTEKKKVELKEIEKKLDEILKE